MIINDNLLLYQRSNHFLWTDNYISKNMLTAHLDLDSDAASRNLETIKKTVKWIKAKIPENGRILDLGCGPGLYTTSLARKGYSVTGIDISQNSISYARKRAVEEGLRIDFFCKDYLQEDIGTGYDVVIFIYCDFGALIPSEQKVILNKIYNSLNENGVFIFDVFQSGLCKTKKEKRDWHYMDGGDFWSEKPHLLLEEVKHFSKQKAWGTRTVIIENKETIEYITWDNYYTINMITKFLKENNFQVISFKDNLIAKNEFTSNDVLFIEASKITRR
jgi:SAM-dependent methyltransferase